MTREPGTPPILDRLVNLTFVEPEECFNLYEADTWVLAELTNCSATWEYRVTKVTAVPSPIFPGQSHIESLATTACGDSTSMAPSKESWPYGDRVITCLMEPEEEYTEAEEASAALAQGIALTESGNFNEALTELARAQKLHGGRSAQAESWMGFVQEDLGNAPQAIQHHSNALALEDSAYHRINRAWAHVVNGDAESARNDATAALDRSPETTPGYDSETEAHWILALTEEAQENHQEALQHAHTASELARANGYEI